MTNEPGGEFDEILARRFDAAGRGHRGPFGVDGDGELTRLRGRFEQARQHRRRQVLGVAGALVVAVSGIALLNRPTTTEVRFGGEAPEGASQSTDVVPSTTTTSVPEVQDPSTPTVPSSVPDSVVAGEVTTESDSSSGGSTPSTSVAARPRSSTSVAGSGPRAVSPVPTAPVATPSTVATPPTTTVATQRRTFASTGGTVVVDVLGGSALSLVSANASPGFTSEVRHNEPGRVEVQFDSTTLRSRVEVRIQGNQVIPAIEDTPR